MSTENKFLFNFAVSHSGGGHKRLYEYAKWFDRNNGASFVIHPNCQRLIAEFKNNRFFVATQSRYQRLYNDCAYLGEIEEKIGQPDFYYAYGIPIYIGFGKINWFHLSNVLPLSAKNIPLSVFDRLKLFKLGQRIRKGLPNSDVISAESNYSLQLIGAESSNHLFLSVNGSDDELAYMRSDPVESRDNIAIVVGTYSYKALDDSYNVFETLKRDNDGLKLMIIGIPEQIPARLRRKPDVIVRGILKREAVIACLRNAKFYISTTYVENSYNAASEGIFIADQSYISDIGPHRELLMGEQFDEVSIPNVNRGLLRVRRDNLSGSNLKTWETVVVDMLAKYKDALQSL